MQFLRCPNAMGEFHLKLQPQPVRIRVWKMGEGKKGNGFQSQDPASIARRYISHFNGLSMRCAQGVGVVGGREYYTQHYANALMAF